MKFISTNLLNVLACAALLAFTSLAAANSGSGNALPPDGGEPYAAYPATMEAYKSEDWDAWKNVTQPARVAEVIDDAGDEESAKAEHEDFAPILAAMAPTAFEFVDGQADGDRATLTLNVTGGGFKEDDEVSGETVTMIRIDGRWYIDTIMKR